MSNWLPALWGCLVGVAGTGLGGLLVSLWRKPDANASRLFVIASGGMMLSISLVDMLPEAWEIAGPMYTLAGLAAGLLVLEILRRSVAAYSHVSRGSTASMSRLGLLVMLGIALHNFPEGLAIGSGMATGEGVQSYGFRLSLLLMAHDIPEGIAVGLPLRMGRWSRSRIMGMALLSGLPEGLGAALGYWLGGLSGIWICVSIAFGAGAMIHVTLANLLPESMNGLHDGKGWLALLAGMAAGLAMVWLF